MPMPNAVRCQVAFNSNVGDLAPVFIDLSDRLEAFDTSMGRDYSDDTATPGTATVRLDNSDGYLSPRNTDSPVSAKVRPMKRVRIEVEQGAGTGFMPVFDGYADSWTRSFPGGGDLGMTVLAATDFFKILAKRDLSVTRPQETAAARISALLVAAGVPAAQQAVNLPGYASRTLVAQTYTNVEALSAIDEAAFSDGGLFYADPAGVLTFDTYAYRTTATRATMVQGDFGNVSPSDIRIASDLTTLVDDQLLANRVYVTAANGARVQADDLPGRTQDGLLVFELGQTQLLQVDAEARADALMRARRTALDRAPSLTLQGHTGDVQLTQSLARRLSDRVSLNIRGDEITQQYHIESVSHSYAAGQSFETTWTISAVVP